MLSSKNLQINTLKCRIELKYDFMNKQCPYKQKIKRNYIPHYLKRLKGNNKNTHHPSQDRLAQLTTQQIDRIVHIQKVKEHLQQQKQKIKQITLTQKNIQGKHLNIYSSSFLAKVNRIAINKNIRHLRSEQFDQNQQEVKLVKRAQELAKQRQDTIKYQKLYRSFQKRSSTSCEDNKSISSIQDNLEQFQKQLPTKRNQAYMKMRKSQKKRSSGMVNNKWFSGMSKIYIQKDKKSYSFEQDYPVGTTFDLQFMRSKQNRQKFAKSRNTIYSQAKSTNFSTIYDR